MKVTVIAPPEFKTSLDKMQERINAEIDLTLSDECRCMMTEMRVTTSRQMAEIHMRILARQLGISDQKSTPKPLTQIQISR